MKAAGNVAAAIPAYQAQPFVAGVVRETIARMGRVLLVDDGSTDSTAEVARAAGARVLRHETNRGKGRALRTAFEDLFERGFEHVVTLDADGQHVPDEIPRLIETAGCGVDLVIGSRDHLFAQMHPVRRTSNRWSSRLISAVAGRALADVQSGFRMYSKALIEHVGFPEPRFEAESAVVVRAARAGFSIATVPVRLEKADGRSTSHYRPFVDSLRIAFAVIRARLEPPHAGRNDSRYRRQRRTRA